MHPKDEPRKLIVLSTVAGQSAPRREFLLNYCTNLINYKFTCVLSSSCFRKVYPATIWLRSQVRNLADQVLRFMALWRTSVHCPYRCFEYFSLKACFQFGPILNMFRPYFYKHQLLKASFTSNSLLFIISRKNLI